MLYHTSIEAKDVTKTLLRIFGGINIFVFLVWILFLIFLATAPDQDTFVRVHLGEAVYACILCTVAAIVFLAYGILLWRAFGNAVSSPARILTQKILVVSLICAVDFLVRSLLLATLSFVIWSATTNLILQAVEQAFFEAVPICLIVVIGNWITNTKRDHERQVYVQN